MTITSRDYKCSFTINLPTEEHAVIMKSALEVDQDIAPIKLTKSFSVQETKLFV
ncbi:MAG: hypothetical protein EOP04_15230 [Proteobacteria bacterium]|nr:MAG: hypothetical protein EOP04_15230 [Pseudomonadota bacterium]